MILISNSNNNHSKILDKEILNRFTNNLKKIISLISTRLSGVDSVISGKSYSITFLLNN